MRVAGLFFYASVLAGVCAAEGVLAFPGAEGFGAHTPGGRGGKVLLVTTLEDYAPGEPVVEGSLRAACEAKGKRIVVFRVAGLIDLKATLSIEEPFITIAGQSAPGDGVCLRNYACVVRTHDVIIRYLRCRPGDRMGVALDALSTTSGARNVILDHCSASWGNDETLSVSGAGQTDITVQWCMITESMDSSHHEKGAHGYGTLLRTDGNVTFHHNLYAHHRTRCPRPGTYGDPPGLLLDFRNNVIYNWITVAGYTAEDAARINYVGNYLKPGKASKNREQAFSIGGESTTMYVTDNVLEGVDATDPWQLIRNAGEVHKRAEPFAVAPVETEGARAALEAVLGLSLIHI